MLYVVPPVHLQWLVSVSLRLPFLQLPQPGDSLHRGSKVQPGQPGQAMSHGIGSIAQVDPFGRVPSVTYVPVIFSISPPGPPQRKACEPTNSSGILKNSSSVSGASFLARRYW